MSKKHVRRAFSYTRFSSAAQADGGSLARQTRLTREYCERRGFALDESLTLNDLGVSAFRGDNVRDGALAGFLEACRSGRVPRGSVLIVESLDRLSRDQIRPALQLFLALQDYGITIVTHEPQREYDPEATDALALIEPLIVFARAHEESAMKSHRRRDGWKQARDRARQGGGAISKYAPAWLRVEDGRFQVDEAKADTVRLIYSLARTGLGVHRIAARLTRDKIPTISAGMGKGRGQRWTMAYVWRILTSPAPMGTYQPQRREGKRSVPDGPPLPNYYPEIISPEEWQAAQVAVRSRGEGRGAGRPGCQQTNLFTGLCHCAMTGERMHVFAALGNKSRSGDRRRYLYLGARQQTGAPRGRRIDYTVFEAAILSCLAELRPGDILAGKDESAGKSADEARLSGRLLDIDSRLEAAKQRARTAGDFDALLDLIQALHAERQQVSERLAALREGAGGAAAELGEAQSLVAILARAAPAEREELRRRLKVRIRQLVTDIRVLVVKRGSDRVAAAQLFFVGGRRRSYLIMHRTRPASWWARSLAEVAAPGDLDLRKRSDARKLESALSAADLSCGGP